MRLPPGPNLSSYMTTWRWIRHPFPFLDDCARQFGDVFSMRLAAFPIPLVVFSKPEAVKEIFADDGNGMHAGEMNKPLAVFLGESSVLLLDGKEHLRHRRVLLPPFHGERMQSYGAAMIEETHAAIAKMPENQVFSFHPHSQSITLRVILRSVFGFREGPKRDRFERILREVLELGSWAPLLLPIMQHDLGPWSPWGRWLRKNKIADELFYEELAERKQSTERGDDVMSLLLAARDEDGNPMTDAELRDELTTLLVAGHETTATALAWALRWILASPDVEERLRAEISAAQPHTPEKIAKLEYLDAVIRESMRLNPVIPIIGRMLKEPIKIGDWELPAGVGVICSIYLAHRRAETHPRPWLFDPDRFLKKKFTPYEIFPFGGGIRRCIGMSFALYEMKMVLATLLSRMHLSLAPGRPIVAVRRSVTLAPSDGLRVIARPAESAVA